MEVIFRAFLTNTGSWIRGNGLDTIVRDELLALDTDHSPSQIRFTVSTPPTLGQPELSSDSLSPITSFTQADINANRVRYRRLDWNTENDSFAFTVSDSAGGSLLKRSRSSRRQR